MAIAYGAAGAILEQTTASTTWNVPYPAGISAGEMLIVHISAGSNISSTLPSGWTLIAKDTTTTSTRIALIYKIASGSESGNLAVTMASGTGCAIMHRYSGVDSGDPLDSVTPSTAASGSTVTSVTLPSITTNSANSWIVAACALNSTSQVINTTSGMTERYDFVGDGGGGSGTRAGSLQDEARTTAGATGTRQISWSAVRTVTSFLFALKEDAGGPPAFLGSLIQRVAGISATPTTAVRVAVKTSAVSSARLKLGTDSGLTTGVVFGSSAAPDADGYVTLTATGLTANTRYYYRVEMTDANSTVELDSMSTVGRIKTAPSGQASFAFDFGSCANSTDPIVFPLITARADDMFFHLGDMFYNDGSGTTLSNIRSKLEGKIQATNHAALYAQVNFAHTPSDHDVAQNDSNNGSDPTAWGNYRTASAQLFPDVDFYYTWVWGRVRFIKLDTKNFADDHALTDNSSKSLLGTTQKQWFKDTIEAATEPAMVIVQSDPWSGSAIAGDNGWFGYTTERTELANYMVASGKNFIIIAGDMHAAAADDGTNSPGGITLFHAAPFGQTASQKGGPYTQGPIPSSGTAFTTHYGRVVVTDNLGSIEFAFNAYDSTDTSVLSLSKTFTIPVEVDLSGSGTLTATATPAFSVAGTLSGSGTLTAPTRTPAFPITSNLSGSGTLSSSVTVAFSRSAGLSGSGTLVGSNQTPAITVTPGLSGSGTLEIDQDAVTLAITTNLSGSGTLSKAVVVNFTGSMASSSEGTLTTATNSVGMQASAFLSSSGTLAGSGFVPAITKSVGLSGSGTLTATVTPAFSITSNLSGDGILSASTANSFERTANLTGSGTLSASVTPALNASAALSSTGTLTGGTVNNKSVSVDLSGSGAMTTQLTSVGFVQSAGLSGSGTLSGSSIKNYTATAPLSGSGQLSVTVVVHKTTTIDRDGLGDLDGTQNGLTAVVSANLVGVGSLVGDPGEAQNYTFDAFLSEPRWGADLAPKRWDGDLL